nr:ribonuclease H-like domain-containing protein [Tanacetum cinerariifolium]
NVSHGDKTGTTSNELDLLFSPMFDELLNGSSKVVSMSSAVSTADAPNQRQQPTTPLNNQTTHVPTFQISSDPAPECQTMALEHSSLSPGRNCLENVSHRDKTDTTSNELDLLFSPMFDELLNGSTKVVSKSSAVSAADASNQHQQSTTPLNTHTTPVPTCQNPPITTNVISSENINQAEAHVDNDEVADDEFINIFSTTRWTKDHSLAQVIGNPSQSVRTRRQLEMDAEMYIFTLTVSRTEPKNIKEAMAYSTWIESIQEELHQFDRLDVWELVDRPLCTNGNPQHALKDKGVIDSGCSRHMIGNISYLSDFQELNGGYVTFRGNSKGGKITCKGKIKTGKLDFKDVYFIKELKFNLFSVSQMCDKKNKVLFTDSECLVLSPDFKLPDESQVLLRVPRENNMYNVNLKDIVPSGDLTCLFAKATIDESNLWHRRLGHINFKTINKLLKDNLVRGIPVLLVRKESNIEPLVRPSMLVLLINPFLGYTWTYLD